MPSFTTMCCQGAAGHQREAYALPLMPGAEGRAWGSASSSWGKKHTARLMAWLAPHPAVLRAVRCTVLSLLASLSYIDIFFGIQNNAVVGSIEKSRHSLKNKKKGGRGKTKPLLVLPVVCEIFI